jgi:HK97 family phage major capsid protein
MTTRNKNRSGLAIIAAVLSLMSADWQVAPRADASATPLAERRTKILADRKAIVDAAGKESRVFTAEENEKVASLKKEFDDISGTIKETAEVNAALDAAARAASTRQDSDPEGEFTENDLKGYSLMRAIRLQADKRPVDGLEGEVSAHMAKVCGKGPRNGGFLVPSRLLLSRSSFRPRAAAITTSTGSGGLSTVTSSDYVEALRALSIVGKLPITIIGGLQGKFAVPLITGITSYWPGEGTAPTAGAMSVGQLLLADKTIGAYQDVTRTFINQTSLDVERFMADDIIRSLASGIGTAILNGTGGANTILGILNNTNSPLVTLSSAAIATTGAIVANLTGSAVTHAAMVAMETAVANGNVMVDSGAYVFGTGVMGKLKSTAKLDPNYTSSGYAQFLANDMGMVNGYPGVATNGMPSTCGTNSSSASALFGNWRDCILGIWGGLDITVDPYALSTSGGLRIIGLQSVDSGVRHAESFSRMFGIAV